MGMLGRIAGKASRPVNPAHRTPVPLSARLVPSPLALLRSQWFSPDVRSLIAIFLMGFHGFCLKTAGEDNGGIRRARSYFFRIHSGMKTAALPVIAYTIVNSIRSYRRL